MKNCPHLPIWTRWRACLQNGFTLVELIISLAVAAVMAAGVLLTLGAVERQTLNAASCTLAADMRYAQRMALIEGRRWGVQFDPARNEYRVYSTYPTRIVKTVPLTSGVLLKETSAVRMEYLPRGTGQQGFRATLSKGKYWQRLTATVSGGRIAVKDIKISADGYIPVSDDDT